MTPYCTLFSLASGILIFKMASHQTLQKRDPGGNIAGMLLQLS